MEPYSLLLSVLILLLYNAILAHFGKDNIIQSLWLIYLKLSQNPQIKHLNELKTQQRSTYIEKTALSPQDQYAKWTKLNRKHDELGKKIESLEVDIMGFKSSFDKKCKLIINIIYWVPMIYFRAVHRKTPVFWLPIGLFPYYLEKLLSWPSAPIGALGLTQWIFLLNSLLGGVRFIIKNLNTQLIEKPEKIESKVTTK